MFANEFAKKTKNKPKQQQQNQTKTNNQKKTTTKQTSVIVKKRLAFKKSLMFNRKITMVSENEGTFAPLENTCSDLVNL